jgi:hypothetical protein
MRCLQSVSTPKGSDRQMQKFIAAFTYLLLLCALLSCSSTESLVGKYHSNFAVHGFFVTRINLNVDSSFGYRMSGDLIFDTSFGHYTVKDNCLVLYHEPFIPDTVGHPESEKGAILLTKALSTNNHLTGPEQYVAGRNKLFVCDSSGKVVKKQFGYSKRRKYLLFGQRWCFRRYYLKRID